MAVLSTDAQWLAWAEDACLEAEAMNDPEAKRAMLLVAAGYVRLAEHAAALKRSASRACAPPG
jgi:hypothetical protein